MNVSEAKSRPVWFRALLGLTIVATASFLLIAMAAGGSALTGRQEAGRYFVGNHGRYTEVTKGFFYYSYIYHATWAALCAASSIAAVWCEWPQAKR